MPHLLTTELRSVSRSSLQLKEYPVSLFRRTKSSRWRIRGGRGAAVGAHRHLSLPSLAGLPGLAERPERNPEQGQVLDEELPRERGEGGEAAGARRPDARR